jgi:hypothetical protein
MNKVTDWDRTYQELKTRNWIILLILAIAGFFMASSSFTLGIILGGFITIANFSFLQHTIRLAFPTENTGKISKSLVMLKSFLRLSGLGVILFILITRGLVDAIGLTLGLSTVVISIVSFGLSRARKARIEGAI